MDRKVLQQKVTKKLLFKFDTRESSTLAKYLIEDLIAKDQPITESIISEIESATLRILSDEPLQYITNRADFYGYQFYVDQAVLIPRPETEELVYNVLQYLKKSDKKKPTILDIGTGSGCIPITIKKEKLNCEVSAIDVSSDALKIAIQNANNLGTAITFIEADILAEGSEKPSRPFDIIISNPPYIPFSEKEVMALSTIKHEPEIALFTDDKFGLIFYERISELCQDWLAEDGAVFLELNEYHASKIKKIYSEQGSFKTVDIIEDLQGKPRILRAVR